MNGNAKLVDDSGSAGGANKWSSQQSCGTPLLVQQAVSNKVSLTVTQQHQHQHHGGSGGGLNNSAISHHHHHHHHHAALTSPFSSLLGAAAAGGNSASYLLGGPGDPLSLNKVVNSAATANHLF
ncbi:hypothetical protein L798_11654 [Zootermopsis nevadensis]|uniref:Uncharacterized protein n=2 Tax=Zootermopsis nevadensis TaxID=136037 RepID=A0A067QYX9_ZOONE|nr:hypothetical protein L798_11654 [Zootermopsis nevadensis]